MRWHFSISNKKIDTSSERSFHKAGFSSFFRIARKSRYFPKEISFRHILAVDLLTRASFLKSFVAGVTF